MVSVKLKKLGQLPDCEARSGSLRRVDVFDGLRSIFPSMIGESLDILNENPHCLLVLQAYADSEASGKGTAETSWRERLSQQVESEELEQTETWSAAHGLLIAYGLIDIELAGRSVGIHYRITGDGKRALAQAKGNIVSFEEAETEEEFSESEIDDSEDLAA